MICNDPGDDRKSQTAPPLRGASGSICAVKTLENVRQSFLVNAGTVVLYLNLNKAIRCRHRAFLFLFGAVRVKLAV